MIEAKRIGDQAYIRKDCPCSFFGGADPTYS